MQTKDERDDQQERETPNPHEQREPTSQEQRGMMMKPSDLTTPKRERFRGMMI